MRELALHVAAPAVEDALASGYFAASIGASSMSAAASVRLRRPEFTSTV